MRYRKQLRICAIPTAIVCTLLGYDFAGRGVTMMVPFPVVMVPMYCLFRWLGWIGTIEPPWFGSFFAGACNVFLLRQFFMTIPRDLSEAARIDGCNEFPSSGRSSCHLAAPR